jgi:DNA polymerase III epsilon subunit-like protein
MENKNMQNLRFDKNVKICVFDLETLNLNLHFQCNRFWQFAYLSFVGDELVDEKDYYVKWDSDLRIGKGAAYVTKYNHEEVMRLARPSEEVFNLIYPAIEDADYIMGHNILGFDLPLLKECYRMYGKDWRHLPDKTIDTNCVARGIFYEMKFDPENETFLEYQYRVKNTRVRGVKSNLEYLAKYFRIEYDSEKLHDALDDIRLNWKVWGHLKHNAKL